ncbi:hypothetical protein HanPSC8_Chr08g0315751 [Helianthus annuus]|nr:hypothetical protein HanPSC8_Chr08g0315751 [Helianthus annuus]
MSHHYTLDLISKSSIYKLIPYILPLRRYLSSSFILIGASNRRSKSGSADKSAKMVQIITSWYKGLMKIHGRLKIGDSWISQNHVWVLLKCVKLDSAEVFLSPYPWRLELELQALSSTI